MCYSEDADRLWKEDPIEYIRTKYGDGVDDESSIACGFSLVNSMCKKRKGVLTKCLIFINQILNNPESTPKQKDGGTKELQINLII